MAAPNIPQIIVDHGRTIEGVFLCLLPLRLIARLPRLDPPVSPSCQTMPQDAKSP